MRALHVREGPGGSCMSARHASPWEMVTEACLAYAEAEAPDDFARARDRLRKAAVRYGVACALGRDREIRIRLSYVAPRQSTPGQLALWPRRTSP